ncbi:MAG: sulfatase family protein [Planctomycetota bacterium]
MKRFLTILFAGCAVMMTAIAPQATLIFVDDLGYGDLSCFGQKNYTTPHLDKMASEGARFTEFYVPMPYCAPSRAAILTGRYPFRAGVVNNPSPDSGNNQTHLPHSEITLAEYLKPLGYATSAIGKWHLGHLPEYLPRTHGFDEYYGILYSNDMRPVQIVRNEKVVQYPVPQSELTKDYTHRALRFIRQNKDQPFFLYLPHAMPHKPLAASEDFYTADTPDDLYADVIRELDWSVGQILKTLKRLKIDDNTLVIFTSDNGPWYGGSTNGLRGMKSSGWDGGIKVPMIARMPGRIPAGIVTDQIAASVDIVPTVCKLTGAKMNPDRVIDGMDIWNLMAQPGAKTPHEKGVYAMRSGVLRVIRTQDWKLHVLTPGPHARYMEDDTDWVDPRGPDGVTILAPVEQPRPREYPGVVTGSKAKPMMLFDMRTDTAEQRDVAAQHPEVVARLKGYFDALSAQQPEPEVIRRRPGGLMHLKGGALQYDELPDPPKN